MSNLVNKQAVKKFALSVAGDRHHKFTRVGNPFLTRCEARLRTFIREEVQRLPSIGKTIR